MASLFFDPVVPTPFYASPSLSVVKGAGLDPNPGVVILDLAAGEDQALRAEVSNDTGATVNGVRVQLWVLAFGTSTAPSMFLTQFGEGGTAGFQIPGGSGVQSVPNGIKTGTFDLSFKPTAADVAAFLAGGATQMHCCVLANVYSLDGDGAEIPDNPAGPSIDVFGDRHHAQRNITFVTQDDDAFGLQMFAANPDTKAEAFAQIQVTEVPPGRLQPFELALIATRAPFLRPSKQRFGRTAFPGLEVAIEEAEPQRVLMAKRPLRDLQLEVAAKSGPKIELTLGPDEPQLVQVFASLPKDDFVLRVFDVTQTQGRVQVGGARVVVMSAPKGVFPRPRKLRRDG